LAATLFHQDYGPTYRQAYVIRSAFVPSLTDTLSSACTIKAANTVKMLRRPATTIQLTQADIDQYEVNRQRKLWEQQQKQQQQQANSSQSSQSSESAQQVPQKSKKDRVMGGR
jgi:hypothetical protein